jgi:hypothetical protein
MNIINCTPHAVTIGGIAIAPSGILPRVGTVRTRIADIVTDLGTFAAYTIASGELVGLPDASNETVLIVSAMVRCHPTCTHRSDLASPGMLVRDSVGTIIGADGLDFSAIA